VDELMALCDRLEAARTAREATRDRLAAASLARLNTPDPETFPADARFALDALPALTTRPDQIQHLRQTNLNLAVRGKLVPQLAEDGTSLALLDHIAELRSQAGGKRSARAREREQTQVSEPYHDIPTTWRWLRIFELGQTQTGSTPSSTNPEFFGDYLPFIKPADLDGSTINCRGAALSKVGAEQSRLAPPGTILMVCIGATLGKLNVTTWEVCFNQQINAVTPYVKGMDDFLALAMKASAFQKLAWDHAGTGTLPIISKGKWELLPVPIPPLEEQRRIVGKVKELMALCEALEASLTAAKETRTRLLEVTLIETLHPASGSLIEAAA
jgi:type I restriction enzyme S subunit